MIAFGRIYENLVFLIHFDKKNPLSICKCQLFFVSLHSDYNVFLEYVEVMRMNGDCG